MNTIPDHAFPDPEQLKIQHLLDEKRRQELAVRYQVAFHPDPHLAADGELDWQQQFEIFDQKHMNLAYLTVHAALGYPQVKPLQAINPADLAEELDTLLEFMQLNSIAVDFLCEVDDREAYAFIVEELLDEKTSDIRGTGMTSHFIYEEFHPNAEYDAKFWAHSFVHALLSHYRDGVELALSRAEVYDWHGILTTRDALLRRIDVFWKAHATINDVKVEAITCQIDGNYATVELATSWTDVQINPPDLIKIMGRSRLRMKRSDNDYWETVQARVPGWDF